MLSLQLRPVMEHKLTIKCPCCKQDIDDSKTLYGATVWPPSQWASVLTALGFCPWCRMVVPCLLTDAGYQREIIKTWTDLKSPPITVAPVGGALPFDWG